MAVRAGLVTVAAFNCGAFLTFSGESDAKDTESKTRGAEWGRGEENSKFRGC